MLLPARSHVHISTDICSIVGMWAAVCRQLILMTHCWRVFAGAVLVDPMCGSGTLLIEAALIATATAPGLLRDTRKIRATPTHLLNMSSCCCRHCVGICVGRIGGKGNECVSTTQVFVLPCRRCQPLAVPALAGLPAAAVEAAGAGGAAGSKGGTQGLEGWGRADPRQ